MLTVKPVENELMTKFRLVHAARVHAMEITKKIECAEDYEKLISELKVKSYSDLLRNTFTRHMNAQHFDRSGMFKKSLLKIIIEF